MTKLYEVVLRETRVRTVRVSADSRQGAIDKATAGLGAVIKDNQELIQEPVAVFEGPEV